jgi:hypothetical protein
MKWAFLVVLCSAVALAADDGVRVAAVTVTSGSPSSSSNPTAASFTLTSGSSIGTAINLRGANGLRVSICGNGGNLSGAGAAQAYVLNDRTGLIERNPTLDKTITVTATSCAGSACPCELFPDTPISGSRVGGWVMYVPVGVTHGGTGVTVRVYVSVGPK